ncbi:chromatin accessibility complex 16kD protein [Coccinella septempunctata]|uniref:chromatin accessibility complex 16kD protein n=1 Tax=Coccinella septempunctata TaxID=41139 RepID=UPI001D08AA9F|nr:chromatin accessibility complex 16kD protein [Coccinella septempunctata]
MTSTKSHLPIGRINTIMKSSSDVENVGKDSVILMSKAAELFIRKLVVDSFNCMKQKDPSSRTLKYQNLATVVQRSNKYHFLKDMTPMKITVREYKRIMARKNGKEADVEEEEDEEMPEEASSESGSDDEGSISSSGSSGSVVSVLSD